MNSKNLFYLLPLMFLLIIDIKSQEVVYEETCIRSFESFAYESQINQLSMTQLPINPWQVETPLNTELTDYYVSHIVGTRFINEEVEIWFRGSHIKDGVMWLIYRPSIKKWSMVQQKINNDELYLQGLFVFDDNSIWSTISRNIENPRANQNIPIFSKLNESTMNFEIPEKNIFLSYNEYQNIVAMFAYENNFWLFLSEGGAIRYSISSGEAEIFTNIQLPQSIYSLTLGPDGNVYFIQLIPLENFYGYGLTNGMLFQLNLETGEILQIDLPSYMLPLPSRLFFDDSGRLWLGGVGYRDLDMTWYILHQNISGYFDGLGEVYWFLPSLLLQSSDGRFWYGRRTDGPGEGVAWYDPQTNTGCVFTDYPSNIVEDNNQTLWMVAGGNLYKYPLND